jgi:hypothetical protein
LSFVSNQASFVTKYTPLPDPDDPHGKRSLNNSNIPTNDFIHHITLHQGNQEFKGAGSTEFA